MKNARRRLRVLCAAALTACGLVVADAAPASAHGIGGTQPTNYESTIERVVPAVDGVRVEVIDLGNRLQLTNDGPRDVVVLGYDDEPYLRVGPRGVFENVKSPATFINRTLTPSAPPRSANPSAPPVWRRVSDGGVARWHDHRSHWMGGTTPPEVERAPDRRHLVDRWVVPLRVGDRAVEVRGTVTWEPPPSPWPAVVLAVALAALVVALSRTRHWRSVLVVALGVLVTSSALHAAGHWAASTAGLGTTLVESVYGIVGVVLGLVALVWAARRGVAAAVPLVLVASVFLVVATGLGDIATIGHALVPSSLPAPVARLAVTCTIGVGTGVTIASALRLRAPTPKDRPRTAARPVASASRVTS